MKDFSREVFLFAMMIQMYKYLGLVSALLLLFGLLYVVRKWPYGIDRTFSQHVARHKSAVLYYILLFSVALPTLLLFFFKWFIPTFELSNWFKVLVLLAALLQLACTLVPETGGKKSSIHRGLAFLSAALLLPAVIILSFSEATSSTGKTVSIAMAIIMALVIFIMLKNKAQHKYLLLLQSCYFTAFFLAILTATYSF